MMMCGGWGDKERLKKHRKRKMEGLRRNVRGKEGREGAYCPETTAERKRVKREGESKRAIALQQHLMASLERRRRRERRGEEGIMRGL